MLSKKIINFIRILQYSEWYWLLVFTIKFNKLFSFIYCHFGLDVSPEFTHKTLIDLYFKRNRKRKTILKKGEKNLYNSFNPKGGFIISFFSNTLLQYLLLFLIVNTIFPLCLLELIINKTYHYDFSYAGKGIIVFGLLIVLFISSIGNTVLDDDKCYNSVKQLSKNNKSFHIKCGIILLFTKIFLIIEFVVFVIALKHFG